MGSKNTREAVLRSGHTLILKKSPNYGFFRLILRGVGKKAGVVIQDCIEPRDAANAFMTELMRREDTNGLQAIYDAKVTIVQVKS